MLDLQEGDLAVYKGQGVAKFTGMKEMEVMGSNLTFYVLQVLDSKKQIMIPENRLESSGLRPVVAKNQVAEVYEVLRERDIKVNDQIWLKRLQSYGEKVNTGSLLDVAEVMRDLTLRKAEKPLSFGEQRMLDQARRLLIQELSVAREVEKSDIEDEVDQIFG